NLRGHNNDHSSTIMDSRRFGNSHSPREYDNKTGYHHAQNVLKNMNEEQYKSFHDEVMQILSSLDDALQLDHTKR
ncbi:9996_t:CDS:2, partial [Funneliformis caledonium]